MAFNSSKSFPKNKIDSYLNSLGLSIGADFNASTGFTKTVYKFQVPTNTDEPLNTGIHILSEIASELTLEDEAFERERKIVEEEWRMDLGKFDRILEQQKPYIFKNSKYLVRDPIGKGERGSESFGRGWGSEEADEYDGSVAGVFENSQRRVGGNWVEVGVD